MKKIVCILIVIFGAFFLQAQGIGHAWQATVKVVDESNQPVGGANVEAWYYVKPTSANPNIAEKIEGLTDTNGLFTASHGNTGSIDLSFRATKAGCYTATQGHEFARFKDSDPNKWNPNLTLVLKKIIKAVPMYAKSLNTHVPDLDKPVGYDLEVGDWVGPYGKGVNADILFTGHFDKHDDGESDFTLTVSFPKAGDGIQEFVVPDAEKGSALHSAHEAPVSGYKSQWIQTDDRRPGKPIETNRDPKRNYFFRVRTAIDDRGNIVSARYGKIYGDFMRFSYYFNPTPNDRNIEFDPKRNLMTNLKPDEGVNAP